MKSAIIDFNPRPPWGGPCYIYHECADVLGLNRTDTIMQGIGLLEKSNGKQ